MAAPGAVVGGGGGGKHSFVNLNVREVLESQTVEETKEISRRVNLEIERKREELRMLVGERYRDLIDAADTIGNMRLSSVSVFGKLTALREKLNTLPTQLNSVKGIKAPNSDKQLNPAELEIAAELKLSLEVPRQVQVFLDRKQITPSVHLSIFYDKKLCQISKPYRWAVLTNAGQYDVEVGRNIKNSILTACDDCFDDFDSSSESLAECMIAKQTLTKSTCQTILSDFLDRRIKRLEEILIEKDPEFVLCVANTAKAIYSIYIDPQVYNNAAKSIKKPKITVNSFGLKFLPKSIQDFNQENLFVEESPRVAVLAEVVLKSYVEPLKLILNKCYQSGVFMEKQKTFQEMNEYRKGTMGVLKDQSDDLMRVVLGTSKSLWTEAFYPVFREKSEGVSTMRTERILTFLEQDTFPRFQKLDEQFDLVSFVWKAPAINEKSSPCLDVDLKLKCLSPNVAEICEELEVILQEFLKDFQYLGDLSLKEFISGAVVGIFQQFTERRTSKTLFLGRFCSALIELCPTVWKLMDKSNGMKLRQIIASVCEECWSDWTDRVAEKFSTDLEMKIPKLNNSTVMSFMPVGEDFAPTEEESVKSSVRVPIQLSHFLHSLLFGICIELARVGPQSIPKAVRDNFRHALGVKIQAFYENLLDNPTGANVESPENEISSQVSTQFIFDLKFCQWFNPKLAEVMEPTVKKLEAVIDPFDLDIINPRLKTNLKRFLFESHLTLGLLFSEESHSFIAQNFKTKLNQSFPMSNPALTVALPLLPI